MDGATPLVVDLDGSLSKSDTLIEASLLALKAKPLATIAAVRNNLTDRPALKDAIVAIAEPDVEKLPINPHVMALIETARAAGRPVVLATGAHANIAAAVAEHYGVFDKVMSTSPGCNLTGKRKANALVAEYGEKGFDYVGDAHVDVHVWRKARKAYVVGGSDLVEKARQVAGEVEQVETGKRSKLAALIKAARPHQWMKNLLIFLPILAAHQFTAGVISDAVIAFAAFSIIASGVYITNDVFDIQADRAHPKKRLRPFAAGDLSPVDGMVAAAGFFLIGAALSLYLSFAFALVILFYFIVTNVYTFYLKKEPVFDVLTLGGLYTLRIFAGAVATGLEISDWMLLFSTFLFLSLAIVKRVAELRLVELSAKKKPAGRGYTVDDTLMLVSMALASGYGASLVFALYVTSPAIQPLYTSPKVVFAVCPLLILWVSRAVFLAHRGKMHDDPLVYAVRDPMSLAISAAMVAFLTWGALF